jgi:hypothetical protein
MAEVLDEYLMESKVDAVSDDQARADITGLINDAEMLVYVCSLYREVSNVDTTCYAVGKVYDIAGQRYGCVTMLSEDVVNIIGKDFLDDTQEKLNRTLITLYIENNASIKAEKPTKPWDEKIEEILSGMFKPLYDNGVRVRLVYSPSISKLTMRTLVFIVYQRYDLF